MNHDMPNMQMDAGKNAMPEMNMSGGGQAMPQMNMNHTNHAGMPHDMSGMQMNMSSNAAIPTSNADGVDPATLKGQPFVDNVAMAPKDRQSEPGSGLNDNGRHVLTYAELAALEPSMEGPPTRELQFHLTGNMERWSWGFNGKRFADAEAIHVKLGERIRFLLINDTMMEHPIHLHGFLFQVENGQSQLPTKHTLNVKPGEKVAIIFTADLPGYWAFHCHLLYHMEMGMFRTVVVA
jgi:FtsP/CotA-like multicopper oxidase with cupredoxin domain